MYFIYSLFVLLVHIASLLCPNCFMAFCFNVPCQYTPVINLCSLVFYLISSNSFILNFYKTHYIQFMAKFKPAVDVHINYKDSPINNNYSTIFLGLTLDSTLSWKTHVYQLSSKLNSACYLIISLKSVISTKNLRIIYFYYMHSIIAYGIIFWGNSPYNNNVFKLQKRAIRIIMNVDNRVSGRELFKKLNRVSGRELFKKLNNLPLQS